MNLFDKTVDQALNNSPELSPLRIVVEKELLHHDILRVMSEGGLLKNLTFIGGTCLRNCYGSQRLSEDLDFTGGIDFSRDEMKNLKELLTGSFLKKYSLHADISEPVRDSGNTDTWKIKIITRPERSDLPAQRINIDICSLPCYERRPAMLKNYYGIDMGSSGIILYAESQEEILADKIIALALRPNRIKNRDIWDILWLHNKNIKLKLNLVYAKLEDRNIDKKIFSEKLKIRVAALNGGFDDFLFEIKRFLPANQITGTIENRDYWTYVNSVITELCNEFTEG
jgi:predicted nucleotidyltransferase component of viral defense system